MRTTINQVHQILSRHRFDVSTETVLQEQIAAAFTAAGIEFQREKVLSAQDRIDFMVGTLGIEVKIKGSPSAIYRQCNRYCALPEISELLLVTGRAMGLPGEIEGKPCYLLNLGRSWL